jgi:transcriptional regulator
LNYPPKHHQDSNINHMIDVIKTYPLATLVSAKNDESYITHLPLIYRESDGKLIGHIDKFNPHALLLQDDAPITIIFSGPQCYISPSIYTTTQLPTWNYIKVHITGTVKAIHDTEAIKNSMITMTAFLEQPEHKYVLEPDNPRMEGALAFVTGFEITITNWEGKFKLSQDKKSQDIANAKAELIRANQESISKFLNRVF